MLIPSPLDFLYQVIGMHIASPNAGEVIQGYALALKKGITYDVSIPGYVHV